MVRVVESVALHGAHDPHASHTMRDTPPFVPKAVQEQLTSSAKRVLQQFVLQKTAPAVDAIKRAFSDEKFLNLQPADVTPPRAWVQSVLQILQAIVTEAAILLPPGDPLPKALVRHHSCFLSCLASHREDSLNLVCVYVWLTECMLLCVVTFPGRFGLEIMCVMQAPGQQHTRGSSMDSHPEHSEGSLLSSNITPGLFRENGVVHLPNVTGTVFSVTLAACTHVLQCAVDTLQDLSTEPGCVHQCQVDLLAFKVSVDMQQTLPFYQDIVAACESACSSNGAVSLLDQPQLEAVMSQRSA